MEKLLFIISEDPIILKMMRDYHREVMAPQHPESEAHKEFGEWIGERIDSDPEEDGLITLQFDTRDEFESEFIGIYYGLLKSLKINFSKREEDIGSKLYPPKEMRAEAQRPGHSEMMYA